MIRLFVSSLAFDRYRDCDARALTLWQTADFESASQKRGPFAHAEQAHRCGVRNLEGSDAPAIVTHLQDDLPCRLLQSYGHVRRAGMADHVGKSLLEYA